MLRLQPLHLLLTLCSILLVPMPCSGHGTLTMPAPRVPRDYFIEDTFSPINFNGDDAPESDRLPANDPSAHPESQSFVCRVGNSDHEDQVVNVVAGNTLDVKWEFAAAHAGDGGLYVSYDHSLSNRQDMRWFKIANFPQQRQDHGRILKVNLPSWLPPGPAVIRWDWYALHNDPWVEFYANCVDVVVESTSKVSPQDIPSYKIQVLPRTEGESDLPLGAYPDNNDLDNGNYWNQYEWAERGAAGWFLTGPPCVEGVEGNCCDLSLYTAVDPDDPVPPDSNAAPIGGFSFCADKGNSGLNPSWLSNSGGNDNGDGNGGEGTQAPNSAPSSATINLGIGGLLSLCLLALI